MRKLLLLLIITLTSLNVTAQTTHAAYCEVAVYRVALFSQKVAAVVDAGTEKSGYIINEDGSKKIFNSTIDLFNFFGKLGWSVSQNYLRPDSDKENNPLRFLLTKQVVNDEEVFAGLNIKNNTQKRIFAH